MTSIITQPAPSLQTDNSSKARYLVNAMHAHGGLAPVDLERFWDDQHLAIGDPFGPVPQVPLGVLMSVECVYDELGIEEDYRRFETDPGWRAGLIRAYNDRAQAIVGRRLLDEHPPARPEDLYPPMRQLHDLFEARREWHEHSWWLHQSVSTPSELEALLDRIDATDVRSFILPPQWEERKDDLLQRGITPPLYRSQRGPVTFATSVYGAENLLFLILEQPDLAARFRDSIARSMLEIVRIIDTEAGFTDETRPRGFSFYDDNCCLLSPEMYEFFGYPIVKSLFDTCSPFPDDWRYQHSDSAMEHLLPLLSRCNFTQVNFGPTLTVGAIRERMPGTIIQGQLAPFTFSRNEEENMVLEFLRDYDMAKEKKGLLFATAGSINNGSRLTGMRLIMAAIQRYGRYE